MIATNTVESVKSAASVVEVIGDFISLKRHGANFLGICPFHDEKTPSFTVSTSKNTFKCFGCGKSGDSVAFIMDHEHFTFIEAIQYLAAMYKIILEGSEKPAVKSEKDRLYAVLKFAQEYFRNAMQNPKDSAAAYAEQRAINEVFQPGSAAEGGTTFIKAAAASGYPTDLLLKAGLIAQNDSGQYYDYFRNRLVLPFQDLSGRIIGFTARALRNDKRVPKYINSPETALFKKGSTLFGLFQAKMAIVKEDECILVEGNIDVSTFRNRNIHNTVCSSGTALTSEQIRLIRRFTNNLTFIYDADAPGMKAALKGIDIAVKEGMQVWLVKLPDNEDPDSFAKLLLDENLKAFIEANRVDFIAYRLLVTDPIDLADSQKKSDLVNSLLETCALVSDKILRSTYLKDISVKFEVDEDLLKASIKSKPPKLDPENDKAFFALEEAKPEILNLDCVQIIQENCDVVKAHVLGKANTIGLGAIPITMVQLDELVQLTKNVNIEIPFKCNFVAADDHPLIILANLFIDYGFNVNVAVDGTPFDAGWCTYLDYFADAYHYYLFSENFIGDNNLNRLGLERTAELLSKYDTTTITLKTSSIAGKFNLSQANFNKILKPYLDKKKNRKQLRSQDIVIDEAKYVFDIENLPPYVDKKFFYKYGFFAAENKSQKKIFYVFRTSENTLIKVANFYMEPLFQVWTLDMSRNKRVVRLNHAELGNSEFVEMPSAGMMDFATFKKFLWNQGGYVFSKGKNYHHEIILESIALQFPKALEFDNFGWQPEGFFAFANGIYADGQFSPVDDMGLVNYKAGTFYSPAFSVIFKDQREDADKYKNDRFLVYKEKQETTFNQWCGLMQDVYKNNDNGMWSVLFMLLAANRSIIFPMERFFTAPFFIGPTESGKSRIAESIRAPFMYGAPLFNLNSGTDAAFFTVLERYRDCPVPFEEYNDTQISDVKFQGLKAAVYDSEGKTKRKDASSKELDQSEVNCAPILLGQESPDRDDGSLANRCVILHVPKKDDWLESEIIQYNDLKDRERKGLSNILTDILKKRPLIQKHFGLIQRLVHKQLKDDLTASGSFYQTRILNTISLFVSMIKFWEEYAKESPLTFTYEQFYEIAKLKIISQSETISQSNRVSVFFDAIASLLTRDRPILEGREFKIEDVKSLIVQSSRNSFEEKKYKPIKRILFLRMNILHPLYREIHKNEALKMNALLVYLKDHPAYIGNVNKTRFTWTETEEIENGTGHLEKRITYPFQTTSALAMDYELLGIDLQKHKSQENPNTPFIPFLADPE